MTQQHRKYMAVETMMAMLIAGVLTATTTVLIFRGQKQIELWGTGGLAFDFLVQTFMVPLMTFLFTTGLTRKRIAAGKLPRIEAQRSPLPRNLWVRSVMVAMSAVAIIGVPTVAGLVTTWRGPMPFETFLVVKTGYCCLVGLIAVQIALRAALVDEVSVA